VKQKKTGLALLIIVVTLGASGCLPGGSYSRGGGHGHLTDNN
jgi:hypothetical protein